MACALIGGVAVQLKGGVGDIGAGREGAGSDRWQGLDEQVGGRRVVRVIAGAQV